MTDVADLLRFSEEVGNLKHVPRRGWILKGIQDPESVAVSREPASTFPSLSRLTCLAFLSPQDHMYRMAVLAMSLPPVANCDMSKVLQMCLVHDLAESRVGDITPDDGIPVDEKHRLEREAMTAMCALLPPSDGQRLLDLYSEYEKHESEEAKLTKDLDIFDFVHQAFVYEKRGLQEGRSLVSMGLQRFFDCGSHVSSPQVKQLVDRLMSERQLLVQQHSTAHDDPSAP